MRLAKAPGIRSLKLVRSLRTYAHQSPLYCEFRLIEREGWDIAKSRLWRQRAILSTPPIRTAESGPCEVRILTCRFDWISALWTLKSFYHFSKSRLPLHIHDGGLFASQTNALKQHFPDAFFHERSDTTAFVESSLKSRGLSHSIDYRRRNSHTQKLFDFYLLTAAEKVIVLDSDVLFFRQPTHLLEAGERSGAPNVYCRDFQYAYAVSPERMNELAGRQVTPQANSGIACVAPESIDLDLVEFCLANEESMFGTKAVVEQSMHAICSSRFGMELLPAQYIVSTADGLGDDVIAKHYVAFPRPWLYREGMSVLATNGFLRELREPHLDGANGTCH